MLRIFILLFIFIITLNARENPFFSAEGEVEMPLSSNIQEKRELLQQASMQLPSTARRIESFSVTYKNLDGSIATQTVELDNDIDWHLPLFLSQSYTQEKLKNKKNSPQKNLNKYEEIFKLPFITFYINQKNIKVVTKDKLLRNFIVVNPHRIVCDFKRDIDIRSITKEIKGKKRVRKIRVGNHKGYYRVVIELDGFYEYKYIKESSGYILRLI